MCIASLCVSVAPATVWSVVAFSVSTLLSRLKRSIAVPGRPQRREPCLPHEGPRDCVLVLDASPSMLETDWKPSRLAAAQEAAMEFVKQLAEDASDARVAIVTYSTAAQSLCGLTPATQTAALAGVIGMIETSDWTNIHAGLEAAYRILRVGRRCGQVVLLTDGQHNTGEEPRSMAELLKAIAVVDCVGIGKRSEVDETLLKAIASRNPDGTPRYRWIGDKKRLVTHFRNLAGGITREP